MAITRKPKPAIAAGATGVDIEALINKGGTVARSGNIPSETEDAVSRVILRVPSEVLAQIDQVVDARKVKTPRHTWLLEALIEKLEREAETPT